MHVYVHVHDLIRLCIHSQSRNMATRGGTGTAQRPNGIPREKVCQFKLVLLGKSGEERGGKRRRQ